MRRIIRTQALCLHTARHRESSKLATFFCRTQGRLTCVAKGARRPKSRFGAALDRLRVANIIYYWHQERTIYTLSDAELVRSFSGLSLVPASFLAAEQIADFLLHVLKPHDPNPALYELTLTYLDVLATTATGTQRSAFSIQMRPASPHTLVMSFLLKATSLLGYKPDFKKCRRCRKPVTGKEATFALDQGGIYCSACKEPGSSGPKITSEELQALNYLLYTPAATIAGPELRPTPPHSALSAQHSALLSAAALILAYIKYHLPGLKLHSFSPKFGGDSTSAR